MDAAHDKLYGRIADLLAQEAQKRNGNLVEFPAEVLQVARQILLAAEKREVYPRISCDTTLSGTADKPINLVAESISTDGTDGVVLSGAGLTVIGSS